MWTPLKVLLIFVALYPVATAALWIAGGLVFRWRDERSPGVEPDADDCPGVTVLIPAFNEEATIATSVVAALASDYPLLEVIVLDDGSADDTEKAALAAAEGDPRFRVVRDPVNRGKAEQLDNGFRIAANDLVVVTDADAHLHPQAVRRLVGRIQTSPLLVAVAGAPHVTNRNRLICALQVLEAASIIGLIRRTQSVTGRVGTVAGIFGLFRRDAVVAVGGYDGRMATEDIDLTWRLLIAGGHTAFEPYAVVGMEVPPSLKALWSQRKRWARGQGEVLHRHLRTIGRWRHHKMWLLGGESVLSVLWVLGLVASLILAVLNAVLDRSLGNFGFGLAWGVAISIVATVQLLVALYLNYRYDRWDVRSLLVGAIYPLAYWMISAAAALRSEILSVFRGPRERRVVWDIPREVEEEQGEG
ncbi:MAG TPA: glycosyltransferase family 2 protein [Solirubrobacterales bacterium]|jgi:biofilm PGA synthesis N-glycosyltransferase PgaC|nr:glycosyltransferase family 2 protein [Solirubrobacterales bacterium]